MDELLLLHARERNQLIACNALVEEFIEERGLIVYGGTAIDFALREHGDKIYEDAQLDFTDYDMFTPNLLTDVLALAERIAAHFATRDVRVIPGMHMRTLRVEFLSIFVADFTAAPESVFAQIPRGVFTTHRGRKIAFVQPSSQVIDMHSALSEPFVDPPKEVYLHRSEKDIKRYNKLAPFVREADWSMFQSTPPAAQSTVIGDRERVVRATIPFAHCLCVGFTAFALLMAQAQAAGYKPRVRTRVEISEQSKLSIAYCGPAVPIELMTDHEPTVDVPVTHRRLMDWFPKSHRREVEANLTVYFADSMLYPKWLASVGDGTLICCAVQSCLKYLIAHAIYGPSQQAFYLCCYWDLIAALAFLEKSGALPPPFLIGMDVWPSAGAPNESLSARYNRLKTLASIADATNGERGEHLSRVLAMRPPSLNFGVKNFDAAREKFLAWRDETGIFAVDGLAV